MEKYYIRSADLEEKIHSVKLPYLAWKVLFLLGEKQSLESLADILGENASDVAGAIRTLSDQGLVQEEKAEAEEAKAEEAAVEEVSEAEAGAEQEEQKTEAPVSEEELPVSEKEVAEEAETIPELTEEEFVEEAAAEEEQPAAEEPVEEPEAFPELEEVEEVVQEKAPEEEESFLEESELEEDEFKGIKDFDLPEVEEETVLEGESELESQISEIEEKESKIELPEVEEETEKLEIDFENVEEPVMEEKIEEEKPEEKVERIGAPTVLVIDDSIVIRKMIELALEGEDFILESATSGKEGLSKLDEIKPDVVILDLMLPDINGIDLLKTVKASLSIPVIMLSGKDSPQMIEKAKAEGADAFLPKPFRDEELVKTIHELVKK